MRARNQSIPRPRGGDRPTRLDSTPPGTGQTGSGGIAGTFLWNPQRSVLSPGRFYV